ncbi:MAG TPA: hypothetical protein VF183_10335, partial [Acidimicrobiales bacterium]
MDTPPVDLIRRALERAVEVARQGERERPPTLAPGALRPVLRFRKLSAAALRTVAQAIEADAEFRSRVAERVDRDEVGAIAWLWLTRPDGWEDEVAARLDELAVDHEPHAHDGDDKTLRRRLEGAERAAAREAKRAERAEADADRLRRELDRLRAQHAEQGARIDELEHQLAELSDQRAAAVSHLKRLEELLVRRTDEKRELRDRVEQLEKELAEARGSARPDRGHLDDLRAAIAELQQRAATFVDELDALQRTLGSDQASDTDELGELHGVLRSDPVLTRGRAVSPAAAGKRAPLPIPGGLTDDSPEAALHLLSRRGAVLLVDGYNVSMDAWPDLEIAEQRARLTRVLDELAARMPGLSIELVFDGAAAEPVVQRPGSRRRGVTVRFT